MRFLATKLVLPVVLYLAYARGMYSLLPQSNLQSGLLWIGLVLLLLWWSIHLMRWLRAIGTPHALVYMATNLITGIAIFLLFAILGAAVNQIAPLLAPVLVLGSVAAAVIWLLASLIHLIRTRRQYNLNSLFWRLLESDAWIWRMGSPRPARLQGEAGQEPLPAAATQQPAGHSPSARAVPAAATSSAVQAAAQPTPQAPPKNDALYRPLWVGDATSAPAGTKLPARPQAVQAPPLPAPAIQIAAPEPGPAGRPLVPSSSDYFVLAAKKAANERGRRCDFVPFSHYWPTYEDMSPAQYRWYLYWRSELREGRLLPTDLSYLFVHVYEVINLVGVPDHAGAYRRLVQLWLSYRASFPKLDNYLVDWIADFIVVQQLGIDPLEWYVFACQAGAAHNLDPDLVLEMHAAGRLPIEMLPAEFLYRISNYSPRQSKFYRTYGQEMALDTAYVVGLAAVDAVQRSTTQKGLLQSHRRGRVHSLKRSPFSSALHGYALTEITIAKVHPWTSDPQLAESVALVLRQTENVLRSQAKYRSLLRGVSVSPLWDAAITAVLTPKPQRKSVEIDLAGVETLRAESEEVRRRLAVTDDDGASAVETPISPGQAAVRPAIRIDAAVVAALQQQSDEVRRRLLAAAEDEHPSGFAEAAPAPSIPGTPALPAADREPAHRFARPDDAADGMLTDLPAVARILGDPTGDSTRLLRFLRDHRWQASAHALAGFFAGSFASVALDRVNESALEALGDSLLFDEGGEWVVADDYRDEITYLLDHPEFSDRGAARQASAPATAALPAVDAQWQAFAGGLKPWHWRALAFLALDGASASAVSKLEAVARSQLVSANQLIDEINTVALDTVGDNLVDVSSATPRVFDDYVEPARTLAQWALANEKTEVPA